MIPKLLLLGAAAALSPTIASSGTQPRDGAAKDCPGLIHRARVEAGLPASPADEGDQPLLLSAVDKRIGNCRVLVMANDNRDIRPEPKASFSARLRPAQ